VTTGARSSETLRDVNQGLAPAKRIRLVGGNEGIDWSIAKVTKDLARYPNKTNLMPHLLAEHLAKEPANRTLVVYGDCHIHWNGNNFMHEVEAALGRSKLFVVGRINELVTPERVSRPGSGRESHRHDYAHGRAAARTPETQLGQG